MGTTVADVVARVRGDFSDIDAGADRTAEKLSQLGANIGQNGGGDGLASLSSGITRVNAGSDEMIAKFGGASGALEELTKKGDNLTGTLKSAILGVTGAAGLGALLDTAKNTTAELETLGVQFNTTFAGSGASALKAAIGDANQFGVSIGAAAGAYQSFGLATKGTNQNMKTDMKEFSDIAAGTGESIDAVSSAIGNYYQLVQRVGGSGGQASRYATSLLTSHIIDPQTYNQLRLLASQGANPQELLNTIMNNGESQYGGAGKAQANTLGGQIQTFKNQFAEGSAGAFSPIIKDLQGGLKSLNQDMSSQGFKQATEDIAGFVAAMAHGVAILEPFAKTIVELVLEGAKIVSTFHPLAEVLGLILAAFIAIKAINFVGDLLQIGSGVTALADKETGLLASLQASTAAMIEQTAAAEKMFAVMAAGQATSVGGVGGVGTRVPVVGVTPSGGGVSAVSQGLTDAESQTMFQKMGAWMTSGSGLSIMGLVGSQLVGHMVGGSAGNAISTIGGLAGTGGMIGTMIEPGVGTAVGAGVGALVGGLTTIFQSQQQATAANTAAINTMTANLEKQHPLTEGSTSGLATSKGITDAYNATSRGVRDAYSQVIKDNGGLNYDTSSSIWGLGFLGSSTTSHTLPRDTSTANAVTGIEANNYAGVTNSEMAALNAFKDASGAMFNMRQNLATIGAQNSLSPSDAAAFAQKNNIDLSAPLNNNISAINTATEALKNLGGSAQFSAEQISSSYNTIAAIVGGQYGEQGPGGTNPSTTAADSIANYGKSQGLNASQSIGQFFNLGNQAGVDFSTMGITPQSLASNTVNLPGGGTTGAISPQEAQLKNQMLSVTLQYTQALQGEQQAAFAVGQAEFSLSQAYFAQSQAVFSASQAMFSFGRAILANTVAQITQRDATAATTTAINSGYLPANANIAASLAQVTSLTAAQINTINAEVTSYNALEAAMYGAQDGGQSLFAQYTMLQGAVQELQAQTQQYQNLLNEPLAGSKAYSAQQEQYTVQEAALQQQIAQLELAQVPTQDPRIQALQTQLQKVQVQSQLATAVNTQGLGQQQFQIQQAQLGPEQSYNTQIQAAKAVGDLNTQLLAAQQALAPVNASYVALNSQLTIAQQKNSAVTGALQAQATADQGAITANNSLVTAANGVTTSQNGLVTANNAVKTAAFNVTTSQWAYQASIVAVEQATNTFASTLQQNIGTALTEIQGFVTSIGTAANTSFTAINQALVINAELTLAQLSGNAQLMGAYMSLQTALGNGEKLTPALINSLTGGSVDPNTMLPQASGGGAVGGTGAVNVHSGESILTAAQMAALQKTPQPTSWNDIYNEALGYGGTQIQAMAAAALANGIETGIGGAYGQPQSKELAGGIGPAQGLFQFEPPTWRGDGGGVFGPIAGDATWQQQVGVFINATRGNDFGSWGPDFGTSYGGATWPPGHGSPVANMIDQLFGQHFINGGFVPGSGEVPIMAHGGEFIVSNAVLAAMGNSSNGGGSLALANGAIQVEIHVVAEGHPAEVLDTIQKEAADAVEQALASVVQKWSGA